MLRGVVYGLCGESPGTQTLHTQARAWVPFENPSNQVTRKIIGLARGQGVGVPGDVFPTPPTLAARLCQTTGARPCPGPLGQ